jgi:Tol biopolymer transport system component
LGVLTALLAFGMQGIVSAKPPSTVELVSVNKDGTDSGNDDSSYHYSISADGRFVAFQSTADDLVATDTNGTWDVFVRDRESGTTTLVSVNKDGTDSGKVGTSGWGSFSPMISADGRFVTFTSDAADLVATDANGRHDIFVRDLQSGTTNLVSVNEEGADSGNGNSWISAISADGRFVAFTSIADDLVNTDTNGVYDVFVRDLQRGSTTLVSVNKDETDSGNDGSNYPVISSDGRIVAFESYADDLVATDTNGKRDVFVRDFQSGTTTLVSVNKDGTDSGNGYSNAQREDTQIPQPTISADGRFVAFESTANDLVATDTGGYDVFVRDLQNGTTTLISVNKDGTGSGNGDSWNPVVSPDGQFVAFTSFASDLVETTDTNGERDVFVRDLQSGTTTLVSINKDGTDSGTCAGFCYSSFPMISPDGRFVVFNSGANDLVATDNNGRWDVFVRDLQRGTTSLVNINKDGTDSGNSGSWGSVMSADGRVVAFQSSANDLVATDTNGEWDIFAFDVFKAPQGCDCAAPDAIKGTSGPDFLYGTQQADIICSFGGNDFIAGKGGDDCIDGGSGNDWIYGGRGNDKIFGRTGKDVVYGHRGNDEINGNKGEDYLFGGGGDDKIDGGEGYDWIFCGRGADKGIGEYTRDCEN